MRIYSAKQILEWENFHFEHSEKEPYDLMTKASTLVANWIDKKLVRDDIDICILCGKGNNGGDGYTVAQILRERGLTPKVYDLSPSEGSQLREHAKGLFQGEIQDVHSVQDLHDIGDFQLCIDAIFGIGIDRPLEGLILDLVEYINEHAVHIMSVDIPSGMYTEEQTIHTTIKAQETCTFTSPKRSFFSSTNEDRLGLWVTRDLDLNPKYHEQVDCSQYLITKRMVKPLVKPRIRFSHKDTYGHCLFIGSSVGMAGALALAGRSALRTGAGLVTLGSVESNRIALQSSLPEAMVKTLGEHSVTEINSKFDGFNVIGIGPGLGRENNTRSAIQGFLSKQKVPLVIDADALNLISELEIPEQLPSESIITPHPKEFDRIFGYHKNDFDRRSAQIKMSVKLNIYIVLKGAYTTITTPSGDIYFNQTGNPGMAVGGSGDILTGMICSLIAQGYSKLNACTLGVYMHGLAGDLATKDLGQEFMISTDIINYISSAYKMIKS